MLYNYSFLFKVFELVIILNIYKHHIYFHSEYMKEFGNKFIYIDFICKNIKENVS